MNKAVGLEFLRLKTDEEVKQFREKYLTTDNKKRQFTNFISGVKESQNMNNSSRTYINKLLKIVMNDTNTETMKNLYNPNKSLYNSFKNLKNVSPNMLKNNGFRKVLIKTMKNRIPTNKTERKKLYNSFKTNTNATTNKEVKKLKMQIMAEAFPESQGIFTRMYRYMYSRPKKNAVNNKINKLDKMFSNVTNSRRKAQFYNFLARKNLVLNMVNLNDDTKLEKIKCCVKLLGVQSMYDKYLLNIVEQLLQS